jgi:hypothetical protein
MRAHAQQRVTIKRSASTAPSITEGDDLIGYLD